MWTLSTEAGANPGYKYYNVETSIYVHT